jgi:hypothetical protein
MMPEVGWLLIGLAVVGALFALSMRGREQFAPRAILSSPDSFPARAALVTALAGVADLITYWIGLAMIAVLIWEAVVQVRGRRVRRGRVQSSHGR